MRRAQLSLFLAVFLLLSPLAAQAAEKAPDAAALAKEGNELYRSGAYAEALKKFEGAMAAGMTTPAILYKAATCYAQALGNRQKELELKRRALPLLEEETAGGGGSVEAYYYLTAIYMNDLGDAAKGMDAARRGVALAEKQKEPPADQIDTEFRVGRLYTFLGNEKAAAARYQRFVDAASKSGAAGDRVALKYALASLAAHRMTTGDHAAAVKAYQRLLEMDPLDDRSRHQMGLARLRAGEIEKAAQVWSEAASDAYRTELMYLARVVTRYAQAGKPQSSKLAPNAAALDDQTLVAKIEEAAGRYREIRVKEEEILRAEEEKERTRREAEAEEKKNLTPEEVKARMQEKIKKRQEIKAKDPDAFKNEGRGYWAVLLDPEQRKQPAPVAAAPKSPENAAAEREFLFMMLEYVKRGHLIRNFCFERGLMELLFR